VPHLEGAPRSEFEGAMACRMAVDSCRFGQVLRWDPVEEKIFS